MISKFNSVSLSEDVQTIPYQDNQERCGLLNKNPVLVARDFQFRVEVFFKEIILNGSLGSSAYYVIRVEFQVHGSPHGSPFLFEDY